MNHALGKGQPVRPKSVTKRLEEIADWPGRARVAEYSPRLLMRNLAENERTVRRFFKKKFGVSISRQLERFRQQEAKEMARQGLQAKVIAFNLSFKSPSHFSHWFKAVHKISFRVWLVNPAPEGDGGRGFVRS